MYEWGAVLDWDFTYRERQATYGFMWGHISPNMHMPLVSRPRQPYQRYKPMSSKSAPSKSQSMGFPIDTITTMENVGCLKRIMGIVRLVTGANSRTLWPQGEWCKKQQPTRVPVVSTLLRYKAWDQLLPAEYNGREQLLRDIREGFRIINNPVDRNTYVEIHNYECTMYPKACPYVEQQIREEIAHDRYGIESSRPHFVSVLGALAKNAEGTKFGLIHDASRSTGQSLNDVAVNDPFKYQSIQDAVKRVKPG